MIDAIPDYIGGSMIGQDKIKNKLNFYIHNQRKNGFLPFIMFHSSRGSGKTMMARALAKNLQNLDGTKRKAYELNGVSLQSVTKLVDEILVPYVIPDQQVTIFVDEVAECSEKVISFLLSVLQPDAAKKSSVTHNGSTFDFDFRLFNFICATTNGEKLREAFKSRFKKLEIEQYSLDSLKRILFKYADNLQFLDGVEEEIVKICRDSPREVVLLSNDINQHCSNNGKGEFGREDWEFFVKYFDIKPYGLTVKEVELLEYLVDGPRTLTSISGKLYLDPSTVRREIELFLLTKGFIIIDVKRKITNKGLAVLKQLDII